MGIVYTPIEIVDFIIKSVNEVLQSEFNQTLGSKGVHIIDPFTGTGTFITRLLQSGLIKPEEMAHKYANEIHANEILLLAYYIAAINIEATYHELSGGDYKPFPGICLTDTFQLYEKDDLVSALMTDNSSRRSKQKKLPIRVIIGNPPYSVGQGSANDDAANIEYPTLDERIRETYAARTRMTNKRALYDSYIRAIRWGSDRLGQRGVMAFVTNGGWIDGNVMDGLRQCLAEEFSSLYVLHLRGNARTSGERRRKEKDNIFGQGSRAPIAVTLFVKDTSAKDQGRIVFHDIGDYLTRDDKLAKVVEFGSIGGLSKIGGWREIVPDDQGGWINQGRDDFQEFVAIGSKSGSEPALFDVYSAGMKTNRDPWVINSSRANLANAVRASIVHFNAMKKNHDPSESGGVFKWCEKTLGDLASGKKYEFDEQKIRLSAYRPFFKQWLYMDGRLNWSKYLTAQYYPTRDTENLVISLSGPGFRGQFSALMANLLPSIHFGEVAGSQCFPLYVFGKDEGEDDSGGLFSRDAATNGIGRRDGITDAGLEHFRAAYPGESITKEDIFFYVYGVLHSEDYRDRYSENLAKELPRIPRVKGADVFNKFVDAGRRLSALHVKYEQAEPYSLQIKEGDLRLANIGDPVSYFRVEKMKFAGKRGAIDKTTVVFNPRITLTGIPLEAYDYVVNGKSALEWVMERQCVKTDPASSIVNDANLYANETVGDPMYPLVLFQRMITVSLETMKIVRSLPPLGELS